MTIAIKNQTPPALKIPSQGADTFDSNLQGLILALAVRIANLSTNLAENSAHRSKRLRNDYQRTSNEAATNLKHRVGIAPAALASAAFITYAALKVLGTDPGAAALLRSFEFAGLPFASVAALRASANATAGSVFFQLFDTLKNTFTTGYDAAKAPLDSKLALDQQDLQAMQSATSEPLKEAALQVARAATEMLLTAVRGG